MHRFIRFFSLIAICSVFVPSFVQGQDTRETVSVDYFVSESCANSDCVNICENLLADTQIFLQDYNLDLETIHVENFEDIGQGISLVSVDCSRYTYISVRPHSTAMYNISPILYDNLVYEIHIDRDEGLPVNELSGLILYANRSFEDAENVLWAVIDDFNTITPRFFNFYIGNIFLAQGFYEGAITWYSSIYADTPDAWATINAAWAMTQLGDAENALILVNRMIEIHLEDFDGIYYSELVELLTGRAQLYALTFDYDNAIADMDEAITIAEENELDIRTLAELYTIRGEIIFLIYEWDRVEENFNTAIELDPTYAPAYFERGVLFYTMTRREDALADFETYLELDPDSIYVEEAQTYIDSIQIELDALGN